MGIRESIEAAKVVSDSRESQLPNPPQFQPRSHRYLEARHFDWPSIPCVCAHSQSGANSAGTPPPVVKCSRC